MEKRIGGKRGRINGNGVDLIQRKVNCGFTEEGVALYQKLFPDHEDLSRISMKRRYKTITDQLADCDNSEGSSSSDD